MKISDVFARFHRRVFKLQVPEAVDTSFDVGGGGQKEEIRVRTLGTFGGVFTPSFLTIIGVIMYLRFGWILSNAGLYRTLIIVLIANSITLVTALSVSSIATNMRMESGGAYYIISRVLGPPAGGSLGISLFFSQAISIALYTIGFCEALSVYIPGISIRLLTFIALGVLTLLSVIGAGFMIRIQYIIMAAIVLSLISIFINFKTGTPYLAPRYTDGNSFWTVFAVFFPAVTGLLAGVSMSGDLKRPERSIHVGILTAVGAGLIVYLAVPVFLAFSAAPESLSSSMALRDAARWPGLVTAGILGATLSSAIGSILAAPRTLQALAYDGIAPKFLGFGVGKTQEPLIALLVSTLIAAAAIFFGNLNAVAGILTMFFLTTYGVLNLSAVFEKVVANPSFRPAIKVPWPVSLSGALGCVVVMFLIDRVFTLAAWVFIGTVFILLSRRSLKQDYGDIWEGFWRYLMLLGSRKLKTMERSTGKNWSPLIQVFATDEDVHGNIRRFASDLTTHHGLFSVFTIIEGTFDNLNRTRQQERLEEPQKESREKVLPVFSKKIVVKDFREGLLAASQAEGFGAGSYNTVILGLPVNKRRDRENALLLRNLSFTDKNILMLKRSDQYWKDEDGPIIVWWGGMENNARLMLILADLLRKADSTFKREIHLKSIVRDASMQEEVGELLSSTIQDLRIAAVPEVLVRVQEKEVYLTISEHSQDAGLVCMGLAVPEPYALKKFFTNVRRYADVLPPVLFVRNNSLDIRYE
jgi:amino acid transporter